MRSAAMQQLEALLQTKKLDGTVARACEHEGAVAPTGIASLETALDLFHAHGVSWSRRLSRWPLTRRVSTSVR